MKKYPVQKEVIEILCMVVSSSNLFYAPAEDREACEKIKFEEFKNKDGDFFFFKNIFEKFMNLFQSKQKH